MTAAPTLVCTYARKYEPDWLVEEMEANVGWVDGFVCLDQRDRTDELWSRRADRVRALQAMADTAGADWILHMDPDERLEDGAEQIVRRIVGDPASDAAYRFRLRELYTLDLYRTDGVWGRKTRRRLYHLARRRADPRRRAVLLERPWMYHLKHIEPANRALRARVFDQANTWDRGGRPGGGGFGYLADETGMVLEPIPDGRGFTPPHTRPYRFQVPEHLLD